MKSVKNTNGGTMYSWIYDSSMTPLVHRDAVNTIKYNYSYDSIGRLIRQTLSDNSTGDYIGATEYTYDLRNNVTKVVNEMGGRTASQWYQYNSLTNEDPTVRYEKENLPVRYLVSSDRYVDYTYDSLNRLTKKTLSLSTPLEIKYYYLNSDRGTDSSTNVVYKTTQVGRENIGDSFYRYTYDGLGNITNILSGTLSDSDSQSSYRKYTYDALNQLVREDNETTGETYAYIYDDYGNITQKKVYTRTFEDLEGKEPKKEISYEYEAYPNAGWSKLLTEYNGEAITYDAIGNPTTYRGATLDWNERQLKSYDKGNTSVTYKYDADGLRASKTVNGEKTTYQYVSGKLIYEDRNGTDIYYYYDSYGTPVSIRYYEPDGTSYRFFLATNQQGDVIGLYNASGNLVVKYEYDAWGNIIAETNATGGTPTSLAQKWSDINPFRYRGYYYDAETELYYLQSRYYDAETGRFINQDHYISTGTSILGFNMFAYCNNNPVNGWDPTGERMFECCPYGNCSSCRKLNGNTDTQESKIQENKEQPYQYGTTVSVGAVGGCTIGNITGAEEYALSFDFKNFALQNTSTTGVSTTYGPSVGFVISFTDASGVYDLEGASEAWGCTIGTIIIDYVVFNPKSNPSATCRGINIGFIPSNGGIELHKTDSVTTTLKSF